MNVSIDDELIAQMIAKLVSDRLLSSYDNPFQKVVAELLHGQKVMDTLKAIISESLASATFITACKQAFETGTLEAIKAKGISAARNLKKPMLPMVE